MRTALTTPRVIEAMAERTGRHIELTPDAAYLTCGDVTWWAPLPPSRAGGVMPKLPACAAGDCTRAAFLLHRDQPFCGKHYEAEGGAF